jgi:hypothetical protein
VVVYNCKYYCDEIFYRSYPRLIGYIANVSSHLLDVVVLTFPGKWTPESIKKSLKIKVGDFVQIQTDRVGPQK